MGALGAARLQQDRELPAGHAVHDRRARPLRNTADQLDVDVTLEAAGDAAASAPKQTQLTLKPGARSGGVEVQFPDGYQAGRTAMITLTLLSDGSSLAARVATPVLPPAAAR